MRVIITGGAGFIGSHTAVELAAAGFEPVLIDDLRNSQERAIEGISRIIGRKPEVHLIDCGREDLLDEVFAAGPVHGVIHFAADKSVPESVADPLKYYQNNIGSTAALMRVMASYGVKNLVFSSSCTVYGQPDKSPVTETTPIGTVSSPYGYTKVVCERMLQDAVLADRDWRGVILRYFNPVGAHPSALIGELPIGVPMNLVPYITQTAAGERQQLTVHGNDYPTPDGSCVRDFIHVVDLARAHVRALQWMVGKPAPLCEVFNLGTGRGNSVLEAVRIFKEATGADLPYVIGPRRAGDIGAIWADTTKSREMLGWTPQLTLRDALVDAWRWQRSLAK